MYHRKSAYKLHFHLVHSRKQQKEIVLKIDTFLINTFCDSLIDLPSSAISPFVILFTRSAGDDGRFGSENVTFKMETTRNEIILRLQTQ